MKKTVFLLFTSLCVTACQVEEFLEIKYDYDILYASMESMGPAKTSIDEYNNVLWSENDQLVAFLKSTSGIRYQIKEQYVGTMNGSFSKVVSTDGDSSPESAQGIDHNVVVYPYSEQVRCISHDNSTPTNSYELDVFIPEEQIYAENSFANGSFPMVAVSSDNQLAFKNICGGIKLQFKGVDKIKSIKVEGIGAEAISGKASVVAYTDDSAPTITMSETASKSITLDCGEGIQLNQITPTTFIISIPPVTFASGMKITVTDTDGLSKILTNTSYNTIKRSTLLNFPVITYKQDGTLQFPDGMLSSYEIFAEGGYIEVPILTNIDYQVVISDDNKDWISVVETRALREEVIVINVSENITDKARSAEVLIRSTDGETLQVISISQEPRDVLFPNSINLSLVGTANCYIVSEAGMYKFVPTKGNSGESVGTISSAEVLWESFGTNIEPSIGSLIKSVQFENGYIYFETPEILKDGNAVIVVKDENSKILWSWHIWILNETIIQQYYKESGDVLMDRNLGALSATPGDPLSLGLYYQWGRKDPFLGASMIDYAVWTSSTNNSWTSVYSNVDKGTIEYAIEHPTTFIKYNSSNYDWHYTGTNQCDNSRWQEKKTIYDPCPSGWKVPSGGPLGIWVGLGMVNGSDTSAESGYSVVYDEFNKGKHFNHSTPPSWYPFAGYLTSDHQYWSGSLGSYGHYWTCTPLNTLRYMYRFNISSSYTYSSSDYSYYRDQGYPIRCLKIKDAPKPTDVQLPVVITGEISDITENAAKVRVSIQSDGGAEVTDKGIIWGTTPNLDISSSTKSLAGYGKNSVVRQISDLKLNTTYYVRAYATNAAGTSYGETKTINLLPVDFSSAKSLGRPSNCYIVPSSGIYYFQCSKNDYSTIHNVFDVKILWESSTYNNTTKVGDMITHATYQDGYVKFITNSQYREGNALLAAIDANGKVVWSWHIWMVNDTIVEQKYTTKGVMMDRNLGAVSSTPGDVGALGLLYQWGRKDPFMGSASLNSDTQKTSTNNAKWDYVLSDATTGTIQYTIENPMTFIASNSSTYDWYYTVSGPGALNRWNTNKTIYDPCPTGWKVPDGGYYTSPQGIWGDFPHGDDILDFDHNNYGVIIPEQYVEPGTWFPMAGYINDWDGLIRNVGTDCTFWSNLVHPDNYQISICLLTFYKSKNGNASGSQGRYSSSNGYSVRCQKQE